MDKVSYVTSSHDGNFSDSHNKKKDLEDMSELNMKHISNATYLSDVLILCLFVVYCGFASYIF